MLATKSNSYTFQKSGIWYFSLDVPLVAGPLAWLFFFTQGLQVYLPAGVYDLINFEADLSLPRRGYQCDWP
jgi:hypothetical protein